MWNPFRANQPPEKKEQVAARTFITSPGKPIWSGRDYAQLSREAYERNAVANACINKIARAVSGVELKVYRKAQGGELVEIENNPLKRLIEKPNPQSSSRALIESFTAFYLISGNAYMHKLAVNGAPRELWVLRPDRMKIISPDGVTGTYPAGYEYKAGNKAMRFQSDPVTGKSEVFHLKTFHPTNDWYGLSPIEAAAYDVDLLNAIGEWNKALLDNSGVPSGALTYNAPENMPANLSDEQYYRLKEQIDDQFTGRHNAGRPLLLDGGLDWKPLSTNPKDMDFIENRRELAREVALVFGVPGQLLGIPGDSTYSNMEQATLGFWDSTVLPTLQKILEGLNNWLAPDFGQDLYIWYDEDGIPALEPRRTLMFDRAQKASFMRWNEKRRMVGLDDLAQDYIDLPMTAVPIDQDGNSLDDTRDERLQQSLAADNSEGSDAEE